MSDGPKTPRASGGYKLWFELTEGLAGLLEQRARLLLSVDKIDEAWATYAVAREARDLAGATIGWAYLGPDDEQRALEMAKIRDLQRRAAEILS